MEAVVHGLVLAFGLILPLGVQNVFIFSQGATQPTLLRALPATITAALCDTLLIVLAVYGLSLIILQYEGLRNALMCVGILFLLYMSYSIWRSTPNDQRVGQAITIKKQIIFALSVSLLNPHAILDIVGVIGTSAMKYSGEALFFFTTTCIVVSWIWFFGLMFAGSLMKQLNNQTKVMTIFNKFSALFIFATAVYLFIGLINL
ncbi:LysE/ArgO family amino acid transporter [Solibacillus daqui]|uniref:LysE/ArgO family amino acid transporter n=1 Tax=Solibacillus daqui TaxID=2912187 RepID=UPI0023655203|nr:LysE family transporter [Solibacillus daqui]